MKKWMESRKGADFNAIAAKYSISPYMARIIRNRDVVGDDQINKFINGTRKDMYDPSLLKDIDIASEIIEDAISSGAHIRIIGDYDIDGICASYILYKAFTKFGGSVDVRLPDRVKDGYGMNENMVREAAEDMVELIVTCDNGIAAYREIELAEELGISVVVTDHHEVPFEEQNGEKVYIIPPADAVVDPKQPDCNYPMSGICGAMVAYKLIQKLGENYGMPGAMDDELLQFAAFATVGDIMDLKDENRIVVREGLELMKNTSNEGLSALIDVTGVDRNRLAPHHISFVLGPCMNATGRLDSAERALELLKCGDRATAVGIAEQLYELNNSRKDMTVAFTQKAIDIVEEQGQNADKVIVVYLKECHESLAGIIAGRLKEYYYRPTIVFTDSEGLIKGSGRSIEDYDMFEELTKVKDLFVKFGGHKMAAGMSVNNVSDAKALRNRLNDNATLTDEQLIEKCYIDIPLPLSYLSMHLIEELEQLAPFGVGNPRPLFAEKDVPLSQVRLLGKNNNVLQMIFTVRDNKTGAPINVEGICFENAKKMYDEICNRSSISILYSPTIKEFNGRRSIQVQIKDYF